MNYIDPATSATYSTDTARWCSDTGGYLNLGLSAGLKRDDIDTSRHSVWRYAKAIGVDDKHAVTLGEGWTPLTSGEWGAVRRHPKLSLVILRAVPALADVARLAVMHHERLDGSGYPYGMTAAELDMPARILQVADVAEALTAERPYRAALPVDEVLSIMRAEAGARLDARAFAALEAWLPSHVPALAAAA